MINILAVILFTFVMGGSGAARPQLSQQNMQIPTSQKKSIHAYQSDKSITNFVEKKSQEASECGFKLKITDVLLALFSFLLVVVSGFQGYFLYLTNQGTHRAADAANKSAEIAERTLIATQRPWVTADIEVGGPLVYNVNGANITLRCHLKNIGRSPATNVWINMKVLAPAIGISTFFDPRSVQQEIIAEMKTRLPSQFGFTLFPGDIISQDITVNISKEELKFITQKVEFITPTIIDVIDYRFVFSPESHQTGFIVKVGRRNTPRPESSAKNRAPAAIFPDEGDIPATDLTLYRSFIEGGYAD